MKRTTPERRNTEKGGLAVEVHEDMDALRQTWRRFQAVAAGGPHDTWEWNAAWLRTAGLGCAPLIALGKSRAGELLFLLPLTIRRRGGCRVLEWLGNDQGNYASGLFHPAAWMGGGLPRGDALLRRVLEALPRVDAVHLADMPESLGERCNPLSGLPGVAAASPGYSFTPGPDWESHFNERFSARQRGRLRSSERQLHKLGTLRYETVPPGPRGARLMDAMIGEKRQWFADRGIADFLARAGMPAFFREIVRLPDKPGGPSMRLFAMSVGGETIATNLGLVFQNRFYGLMASTTPGPMRRHAPGRLMLRHLVQTLAKEGIETIDCGAGEDDDKLRWCTTRRERLHAIVPVTAKGHVYAAGLKLALLAKRHIKRDPRLWDLVKRARLWKASLISTPPRRRGRGLTRSRPRVATRSP